MSRFTSGSDIYCSRAGDLAELSSLGHLLKSSSATLGLTKIKDSCRNIQYYGLKKDETGVVDEPDDGKCLSRIKDSLMAIKGECDKVENILQKFFAAELDDRVC